jgi:hypothetical protein
VGGRSGVFVEAQAFWRAQGIEEAGTISVSLDGI